MVLSRHAHSQTHPSRTHSNQPHTRFFSYSRRLRQRRRSRLGFGRGIHSHVSRGHHSRSARGPRRHSRQRTRRALLVRQHRRHQLQSQALHHQRRPVQHHLFSNRYLVLRHRPNQFHKIFLRSLGRKLRR